MTDHLPIYDEIEHDILHPVQAVRGWFDRDQPAPQTSAPDAATSQQSPSSQPEEPVSLATIAADIKNAIGEAGNWAEQITSTHLPALVAEASKYENDPIVQALEDAILPPGTRQQIASIITTLNEAEKIKQAAAAAAPAQ